jgi:hypothetical protein
MPVVDFSYERLGMISGLETLILEKMDAKTVDFLAHNTNLKCLCLVGMKMLADISVLGCLVNLTGRYAITMCCQNANI